ncbi:hypothetical protein HMPREF1979_00578 [Actinomyces johnsonii F0542]|uniref:Uncharacterized protein n=1 Tax=Actinomyces johnsonii F0542 TaxID=1321818 RepID=U1S0E6_9ACTO|nr:hypothetical protein HMPREF1979_00578 [Actinomyces johnsonii F0542]
MSRSSLCPTVPITHRFRPNSFSTSSGPCDSVPPAPPASVRSP